MLHVLENLGFDWQVALANFVNFLILFFVLKKFLFKPIQTTLDDRQHRIETGLENAEKARTELMMAKEKYEEVVTDGKKKANDIVAGAYSEEKTIVRQASEKAQEEAARIVKNGRERVQKEKETAEEEVRRQAASLVVSGVEKLLRERLTPEKDDAFIRAAAQK